MGKKKRKSRQRSTQAARPAPASRKPARSDTQEGLRAFRAGRLAEAIRLWEKSIRSDPSVAGALAEAYFRRALAPVTEPDQRLADLNRAVQLAPGESHYQYHLGLTLHRRGDLVGALKAYRTALTRDSKHRGAAFTVALAALEVDPYTDLSALPGMTDQVLEAITPVAALLRGETIANRASNWPSGLSGMLSRFTQTTTASTTLWRGLDLLARGESAAARQALTDSAGTRLPPRAEAVRRYYTGVAAAQTGDLAHAAAEWQQARGGGLDTPWLRDNLTAVYTEQAIAKAKAEDWPAAADAAVSALATISGNPTLTDIAITGLDHKAQAAAITGDWGAAAAFWAKARDLLSAATGGGSPRPILQNLAIAYEYLERWEEAAEAWRAVLRTQPRKKTKVGPSDAQWAWVRKRVIEDYKRAGRPDQAITLFRQAIKSDPNDLDARLQLVEALLGNAQENAAQNELYRILERDPNHVEALLRLASLHMERDAVRCRAATAPGPQTRPGPRNRSHANYARPD